MLKRMCLIVWMLVGVCFADVSVDKVSRGYHQSDKTYGKGMYYVIKNEITSYMIYLQWVNATPTAAPKVLIGMPEPWFFNGFLSRGFTFLKINDISSEHLEPKSVTPYQSEGEGGIELLFNFDGVRMFQRFYMKEGKSLLYTQWRRDPSCNEQIQSAVISFCARPSMVLSNFDYQRAIATKSRVIDTPEKGTKWASLKQDDKYWIAYDKHLQPSEHKGAEGPCFLTADWSGVESAKVWYGHVYSMLYNFTLNANKDCWTFAIAEFKKASDNAPFIEKVQQNEDQFSL